MELPSPYIFTIESPVVVFNGRLYHSTNQTQQDNQFIIIGESKYSLEEISKPKELEDLYFEHNGELIEQLKREYISGDMHTNYISRDDIQRQLDTNRTLKVLITEILPVITSVRLDNQIDAALSDKSYDSNQDLEGLISDISTNTGRRRTSDTQATDTRVDAQRARRTRERIISQIESEYAQLIRPFQTTRRNSIDSRIARELNITSEQLSYLDDSSIFNTELTGGANFLRIDNKIYQLSTVGEFFKEFESGGHIEREYLRTIIRTDPSTDPLEVKEDVRRHYQNVSHSVLSRIMNKLSSMRLKINGKFYIPLYTEKSDSMLSDYKKLIEKKIKIESVNHDEFQERALEKITAEKEQLEKLINTDKYEINGAGFEKKDGLYYAFITTPEYVLRSPHNDEYYKFSSAKIGVSIQAGYNGLEIGNPIVMNSYKHPFLSDSCGMQSICLGDYNPSNAKRLPSGHAVLTLLTKAQENLMMGYRTGRNPYHALQGEYFRSKRISELEFKRSGLVCLNDFRR